MNNKVNDFDSSQCKDSFDDKYSISLALAEKLCDYSEDTYNNYITTQGYRKEDMPPVYSKIDDHKDDTVFGGICYDLISMIDTSQDYLEELRADLSQREESGVNDGKPELKRILGEIQASFLSIDEAFHADQAKPEEERELDLHVFGITIKGAYALKDNIINSYYECFAEDPF